MEVRVTYDYLQDLLAQLMNEVHADQDEKAEKTLSTLNSAADQLEDRRLAEHIKSTAGSVMARETRADSYPVTSADAGRTINRHAADLRRREILQFKRRWGLVDIATANQLIEAMIARHVPNKDDFNVAGELQALTKEAAEFYRTDAEDADVKNLSKIKYRNAFRQAFHTFANRLAEKY